jgi:hypothetical protein
MRVTSYAPRYSELDFTEVEQRVINHIGVKAQHGRVVRAGQLWRTNDPRRFRIVRVEKLDLTCATVRNIVTGQVARIKYEGFTIGVRGMSLEREAQ